MPGDDQVPLADLKMHLSIAFKSTARSQMREFGGFDVGKRRKLSVIPIIASQLVDSFHTFADILLEGQPVPRANIVELLSGVLTTCSDEDAFAMLATDPSIKGPPATLLTDMMAVVLMAHYQIVQKIHPPQMGPTTYNGWKSWESIKSDQTPQYRWHHTWANLDGKDFIGFDGATAVGRIFRVEHLRSSDKWFWLLGHMAERGQLVGPSSGYEDTSRAAACRVEQRYDAIREANENRSA